MPEPPDFETVNNASAETTGLLGVKYTPVQGLSIRASHGTGFVPPDVTQLGTPTRQEDYRSPTPDPKRGNTASPLPITRSEEHTSELQSLMRISYAVFSLK